MPYKMENVAPKIGLQSCFMMKVSRECLVIQQATKLLFHYFSQMLIFFVPTSINHFLTP
jgi:hypothetical protein